MPPHVRVKQARIEHLRNRWYQVPAYAMVLGLAVLLAYHSLADLDIWLHLRAGRDLLAGSGFPRVNSYSFTNPDYPWLNHEWLFQILAAGIAPTDVPPDVAADRLNIFRIILVLILSGAIWFALRRRSQRAHVAAPLSLCLGLLLMWPRFFVRPELVSYTLLVTLIVVVEKHFERRCPAHPWRDHSLWRIFAIVLVWAQFHGYAAVSFPLLLIAGFFQLLNKDQARWSLLARFLPALVSLVALSCTPNFWHAWSYPFHALAQFQADRVDMTQTVSELVPLLKIPNALFLTIRGFQLSILWGILWIVLNFRQVPPLRILLYLVAVIAALLSERNIAIYGLTFVLLTTTYPDRRLLRPQWQEAILRHLPNISYRWQMTLVTVATAVVCLTWGAKVVDDTFYLGEGVGRRFGTGLTPTLYPLQTLHTLPAHQLRRTFANLDTAAFVLANSNAKLYIDGRTEAYPSERWGEYNTIKAGGARALDLLATNRVTAVILGLRSGAMLPLSRELLQSPDWRFVAADAASIIFVPTTANVATDKYSRLAAAAALIISKAHTDPTRYADTCLAAANLYTLAQQPDKALQALRQGLALRPGHPALNHNLGNILLAQNRFSEALGHFEAALARNPRQAGSALNAGVCQLRLQHPEEGIRRFEQSLAIDKNQYQAWANLAIALRSTGAWDESVSALRTAIALRPGDRRLEAQLQRWQSSSSPSPP